MIKKILPLLMCVVLLCGCTANMADGGAPTPVPNKNTQWGEVISTPKNQIGISDAEKVLNKVIEVMNAVGDGTLYLSDITFMSETAAYLAQFNQFETELAVYMESLRKLLDSYSSLYARNIGADKVQEQINGYIDSYHGLSEEFRSKYGVLKREILVDIMTKVELMAAVPESSSK